MIQATKKKQSDSVFRHIVKCQVKAPNVSTTFNVKDLSPYLEDVDDSDLRTNHFQPEGNDMYHDSIMEKANANVYGHLNGPLTRVKAK